MTIKSEKYPLERKLERGLDKFVYLFTHIPKKKDERMYWTIDLFIITCNVLAIAGTITVLILRAGR